MSACGEIKFLEGGVIRGSSIIQSTLTGCRIEGSVLDSSSITNLTSVDTPSAAVIAAALAALPPVQLAVLANAIFSALVALPSNPPATTNIADIPTTMYGDRAASLGAPTQWVQFGASGMSIPLYVTT